MIHSSQIPRKRCFSALGVLLLSLMLPVPPCVQARAAAFGRAGRTLRFLAAVPSLDPGGQAVARPPEDHLLRLHMSEPIAERRATIVAPGRGQHNYNLYAIDTRDWPHGVLRIDIDISPQSATDGSFDLFPADQPLLAPGHPAGRSLVGRYDIRRGSSTHMEYSFQRGQILLLGLEGNWFSPRGAAGLVTFSASVLP